MNYEGSLVGTRSITLPWAAIIHFLSLRAAIASVELIPLRLTLMI